MRLDLQTFVAAFEPNVADLVAFAPSFPPQIPRPGGDNTLSKYYSSWSSHAACGDDHVSCLWLTTLPAIEVDSYTYDLVKMHASKLSPGGISSGGPLAAAAGPWQGSRPSPEPYTPWFPTRSKDHSSGNEQSSCPSGQN